MWAGDGTVSRAISSHDIACVSYDGAMITTRTLNFEPDAFEAERIKKASKTGDWDAMIDLAYRNILYDDQKSVWVRVPEEDFDRRREQPEVTR